MKIATIICALFCFGFEAAHAAELNLKAFALPELAVPFTAAAPLLDASATDQAWSHAAEIPGLTLSPGIKEGVPLQKTRVLLLWDKQFLYIRFICEGDDIVSTLTGRDAEYSREDVVEVFLDPVGDEKEFIELQLSPNNGVRDVLYLCTGEPKSGNDRTQSSELVSRNIWTFVEWTLDGLKTAASRFDSNGRRGWIAELAIPANCLRRLGQKEFAPVTLRANFIRLDHPKDPARPSERLFVSSNWSPVVAGRPHRSPAANGYLKLTLP